MKLFGGKKKLIIMFVLMFAILAVVLKLALTRQETRNQASSSTKLYFTPETTSTNPITVNTGETFTLKLFVDPGQTYTSFVKFSLLFDPAKLKVNNAQSIVFNTAAFPVIFEGPFVSNGAINATVSIGNDPTRALTVPTEIATITFEALSGTETTTSITHKDTSMVLSVGPNETASQNTLDLKIPAFVKINGPIITISQEPLPSTKFNLTVFLHGLGNSGDNPNPNTHSLSTKNPFHKTRDIVVELLNHRNEYVATKTGTINYASPSGNFKGQIDLGSSIPAGDYTIKIKSNQYLRNVFPGIQQIPSDEIVDMPVITLVTGDVITDNKLNILDYNLLYGCFKTDLFPEPRDCTSEKALQGDINDEGSVNMYDINLFIRELSVQAGL